MALTFLRHTTPDVAAGICYGRTDLDVTDSFADEARLAVSQIAKPARIISSPLRRCFALAEQASTAFGIEIVIDPRLREMDFGNWEGRLWRDLPRAELDQWADDFFEARPHGGESVQQFQARVSPFLQEYAALPGKTLCVAHAGVIKIAAAHWNLPDPWKYSVPYGGVLRHA